MLSYQVLKNVLFKFDPESVHHLAINAISKGLYPKNLTRNSSNIDTSLSHNHLKWSFPVGLAAGFDKNAIAIKGLYNIGFGSIEVGTITVKAQLGNPRPRIFRHPQIESVRNAMGFPNDGLEKCIQNILKTNIELFPIGINIGKNKDTSIEKTPQEYAFLYEKLAPYAQYIVINISSPNTPGLRSFQKLESITPIIEAVKEKQKNYYCPVFIKISPDMCLEDIKDLCELSKKESLAGIIATNTSIQHNFGIGGLSGKHIKAVSLKTRKIVCESLREDPKQTIIGVGGIDSYEDIKSFWSLGGHFCQIYTSFIYHGPQVLQKIQEQLIDDCEKYKVNNAQELRELISSSKNI